MCDNGAWNRTCTQVNVCALTGAAAFFAGIPDSVIVANGQLWCYFYALRHLAKQSAGIEDRFFCSQPDNDAVVHGTEDCLSELLDFIKANLRPSVVLIENSCSIGLIGDDLAGIARAAALPCLVVTLDSGGLNGGYWEGYRQAAMGYLAALPPARRSAVEAGAVNLLGCTIGYHNAASDLRELKRMLNLAGCRVLACPGAGSTMEEIAAMTRAELNIVVHEELGGEMARFLRREYGMPYLSLLPPYGIGGSMAWLRGIGQAVRLGRTGWAAAQAEADRLERNLHASLLEVQRLWGDLWFENTLVAAPSSTALAIAQTVRLELLDTGGMTVVGHNGTAGYAIPQEIDHYLDGTIDGQAAETALAGLDGGLLLGSSSEKALASQKRVAGLIHQNIALPVYDEVLLSGRPFMGLRGCGHLTEKLWNKYIALRQNSSK